MGREEAPRRGKASADRGCMATGAVSEKSPEVKDHQGQRGGERNGDNESTNCQAGRMAPGSADHIFWLSVLLTFKCTLI